MDTLVGALKSSSAQSSSPQAKADALMRALRDPSLLPSRADVDAICSSGVFKHAAASSGDDDDEFFVHVLGHAFLRSKLTHGGRAVDCVAAGLIRVSMRDLKIAPHPDVVVAALISLRAVPSEASRIRAALSADAIVSHTGALTHESAVVRRQAVITSSKLFMELWKRAQQTGGLRGAIGGKVDDEEDRMQRRDAKDRVLTVFAQISKLMDDPDDGVAGQAFDSLFKVLKWKPTHCGEYSSSMGDPFLTLKSTITTKAVSSFRRVASRVKWMVPNQPEVGNGYPKDFLKLLKMGTDGNLLARDVDSRLWCSSGIKFVTEAAKRLLIYGSREDSPHVLRNPLYERATGISSVPKDDAATLMVPPHVLAREWIDGVLLPLCERGNAGPMLALTAMECAMELVDCHAACDSSRGAEVAAACASGSLPLLSKSFKHAFASDLRTRAIECLLKSASKRRLPSRARYKIIGRALLEACKTLPLDRRDVSPREWRIVEESWDSLLLFSGSDEESPTYDFFHNDVPESVNVNSLSSSAGRAIKYLVSKKDGPLFALWQGATTSDNAFPNWVRHAVAKALFVRLIELEPPLVIDSDDGLRRCFESVHEEIFIAWADCALSVCEATADCVGWRVVRGAESCSAGSALVDLLVRLSKAPKEAFSNRSGFSDLLNTLSEWRMDSVSEDETRIRLLWLVSETFPKTDELSMRETQLASSLISTLKTCLIPKDPSFQLATVSLARLGYLGSRSMHKEVKNALKSSIKPELTENEKNAISVALSRIAVRDTADGRSLASAFLHRGIVGPGTGTRTHVTSLEYPNPTELKHSAQLSSASDPLYVAATVLCVEFKLRLCVKIVNMLDVPIPMGIKCDVAPRLSSSDHPPPKRSDEDPRCTKVELRASSSHVWTMDYDVDPTTSLYLRGFAVKISHDNVDARFQDLTLPRDFFVTPHPKTHLNELVASWSETFGEVVEYVSDLSPTVSANAESWTSVEYSAAAAAGVPAPVLKAWYTVGRINYDPIIMWVTSHPHGAQFRTRVEVRSARTVPDVERFVSDVLGLDTCRAKLILKNGEEDTVARASRPAILERLAYDERWTQSRVRGASKIFALNRWAELNDRPKPRIPRSFREEKSGEAHLAPIDHANPLSSSAGKRTSRRVSDFSSSAAAFFGGPAGNRISGRASAKRLSSRMSSRDEEDADEDDDYGLSDFIEEDDDDQLIKRVLEIGELVHHTRPADDLRRRGVVEEVVSKNDESKHPFYYRVKFESNVEYAPNDDKDIDAPDGDEIAYVERRTLRSVSEEEERFDALLLAKQGGGGVIFEEDEEQLESEEEEIARELSAARKRGGSIEPDPNIFDDDVL